MKRGKDSEAEVPEAKLVVPEMMRLESETVMDRVSGIGVLGGNSTGSKELSLELFHILAAEQANSTPVPTDPAHCLRFATQYHGSGFLYLEIQHLGSLFGGRVMARKQSISSGSEYASQACLILDESNPLFGDVPRSWQHGTYPSLNDSGTDLGCTPVSLSLSRQSQ